MNKSEVLRAIENIKVEIRKNRMLNIIARIIYFPWFLKRKMRIARVSRKNVHVALDNLHKIHKDDKIIFYLGIPIDKNLGDAAQYVCIIEWLKRNFPDYCIVEIKTAAFCNSKVRGLIREQIKSDSLIFVQSGETFDNRHPDHVMHKYLFREFSDNRIVFLPQTVYFTSQDEMNKTIQCIGNSENILFLARDPVSYGIAQKNLGLKNCYLYPDIVTSLIGLNCVTTNSDRKGILFCKRIDGEKKVFDADLKNIIKDLMTQYEPVDTTDTDFYCSYDETYRSPKKYVLKKIEDFAKYNLVITDRFHGMIFSLIANTPCIVLETHGHKVVSGENMLEKYFGNDCIRLVEDIQKISKNVNELYATKCDNTSVLNDIFYEKLKKLILETIGLPYN